MIRQTTLHNILTWVIAVVLFIFQSLNYFIAWIKKYVKHGQKTTTVVTADTTISSESILNSNNVPENVITVQGLIQKHFDIPLVSLKNEIIAEDEPKVYNFIKSAQLLNSNVICKEKTKIDQFMENLVDDSYVARGLGLITATVGRQSEFYLYSKYDNNFENVVIKLNGRNGEFGQITILSKNPANIFEPKSIPMDYIYDKDRIKVTYTPFAEGVYTLTLVRNSLSICRSPYYISVEKSPTNSRSQIRLGTKKYKPVTKFVKSKHSSLETCDNIPVIESNKPSICKNILPESEKNSIRTDVMSIVTKFESNSKHFQKRVHKSTSSISEKGSETDMIDEIPKYSNIPPKIETANVHDIYVSDLNSPIIHSKTKSTDKNFWNDIDITYKNSKASYINTIDFESERIKKPVTKLNEYVGISKDVHEVKNVSSTRLQPTNSVSVESLKIGNSHDVEKHNQTFKTIELMGENKNIEKLLDPTTKIYESEIKCIDNEPCIQNEVSCFDDEDRKTVVVMDSNDIESNPNDTVIQQITDLAQYNINTPFASVITKITNSICEKCSIQVLKIISEFPRDINITHKNNANEMRSSFETLLAQPISININIDNMFEQPISAKNEHDSEHLLTICPTKIKNIGTIDKDIKCSDLNEIEPIENNSDELCDDINNMSKEPMIKQNKHNHIIYKSIKDETFDHMIPFAEHNIDKHNTVCQNKELSTKEIMKIKYSTTNEENVLHSNQFNNNTIHKSDKKIEIQRQHLQKSSEHSMDLIKTNQLNENINKELNHISKESDKPLDTRDLGTINYDKNTNCELGTDEFKINNVIIPDQNTNTNIQGSVINNIVLASKEITLATSENKLEDNEEQTDNISYTNVTLASNQNENQKLMIEKSIEPVLTSFKNKMVEQITQLYLNKDLSNIDNTSTFETHDKHLQNNLHGIQINNNANSTEINTKCIETLTSQLKNHIHKNEISEIILDQQKTDNNHLFKYVENIIKTKINPSGLYAQTLGEIKLQTLVNTAMNHSNDEQIDNEFKIKKINNDEIVQDIDTMLVETPSVTIIKNTDELILSKNEVTVTTQSKIPFINDFNTIEVENTKTDSKQEMQTIDVNANDTIVETNTVEIKSLQNLQKSHNTEFITPIIELQPTLETQITNTSELLTVEENSSKEIQTSIEIIDSINIPEETDALENIDDNNEYGLVKLQFQENVIIKIPHLVEKETLNEVVEKISTNISTKLNSMENSSMKTEIESHGLKKVCNANDVTIERGIIHKLPPLNIAENIVIDKPNPQSIPTLNSQVSKNAAKITIGINTSDPHFSNTAITVLIPSKTPLIENNSFIPKLRILSTLNKLDTIEILTIPNNSATCDTKKTKKELQNTSEPTLSPNKLYMKNRKLEKIENMDETSIPTDNAIKTLEHLNKSGKIKSIPPIDNETLAKTTMQFKAEKNTLHKTFNSKYKQKTLEPTINEMNCNNIKNETTIPINSSDEEVVENPLKKHTEIESTPPIDSQSKSDKKMDEMLICTEAETVIDNSKASLVNKIVVEFVTNKNKTPFEALEIFVNEQIEEEIVTVRETTPTMNSLIVDMDEQVKIKINGSDTIYVKSDDNVTNTGTPTQRSIDQNNTVKIIEKKYPVPINNLTGAVMENPKVNIVTVTTMTSCSNSSIETIDVRADVEKVIEEESPTLINTLGELGQKNMNMIINTENETLLPIESTVECIGSKIEDKNEPDLTSFNESSTENIDLQFHAEKIVEEVLINSLGQVMGENTNIYIVSECETLLPIDSTEKLTVEPKLEEGISETTITPYTDYTTVTVDVQKNVENVIEEVSPGPIHSSAKILGASTNLNIDTENETLSPTESTEKLMIEPKLESDITETAITLCSDSFTVTKDGQKDVENAIEEVSPGPIHYTTEIVEASTNLNIATEKETLSAVESTEKLTVEPKLEAEKLMVEPKLEADITETAITLCTDSSTVTVDVQKNVENVIEEVSPGTIHSSAEVLKASINLNIDTENKTLLPIESTEKLIIEPKLEADITESAKTPCTDSSTVTEDVQKDVEHAIEAVSPSPIISSIEVVTTSINLNIDTENKTLSPTESTEKLTIEPKLKAEKLMVEPEAEKLMVEPKLESDITETAITVCTDSSTVTVDVQKNVENVIEEVSPGPIHSSAEVLKASINLNIDTENKTLLPFESTEKLIVEPKLEADITESAITTCADSPTVTEAVQIDVEHTIEAVSPSPIHYSIEVVRTSINLNIDTENETLSPIESTEKLKVEPKLEADISETAITPCTDFSTVTIEVQKNVENVIEEVSLGPIHSSAEVLGATLNLNIDTENETLSPTESTEKLTIEPKLKAEKLMVEPEAEKFMVEPKLEADITETAVTVCTDSSTVTVEVQKNVENVIGKVSPGPIHSSAEVLKACLNLNIDTQNKTLSPTESTEKLTVEPKLDAEKLMVEPKLEADITETAITLCTDSSTVTVDVQKNVENVIEEVSPGPIHSSIEVEGASTILNIDTENETLSPTESTVILTIEPRLEAEKLTVKPEVEKLIMEPKLEADKTETAITPCTDSSTVTEDVQKDVENAFEEVSPGPIHYATEIVESSTNLNIATENETLSAFESTEKLTVEPKLDAEKLMVEPKLDAEKLTVEPEVEKLIMEPKLETDKTETAITPCTVSSTVSKDGQKDVENAIEEVSPGPIHSSVEVLGASINLNIDTENETLSPIESTEKLTVESKIEVDISETAITSCTDISNVTVDVQKDVEHAIEAVSPSPIHSSIEVEGASTILNIDTENETLSPTESTEILTIEPRLEAEKLTVKPEVEKLIMEPKLEANKTETAITPCTDSSTESEDVQKDVENAIEEVSTSPIHYTTEIVEASTNSNIATENETLSAVESTEKLTVEPELDAEKLIMEPKLETDKTETAITPCTDSSTVTKDGQKDVENAIEEVSPGPIHYTTEIVEASTNLNIATENETLSAVESTEKLTVEPKLEAEKLMVEPKLEADITETAITLCTDSSTVIVDVQKNVENVIEEISPGPIHSSAEVLGASINLNIDTENETLSPIESTEKLTVEPKIEADISETAITPCTDFSNVTVDVQKNIENVIEEVSPGPIHSSIEVEGASTILNIDTENETLSPTEPTVILTIEPRLEAEKLTVKPEVEKLIMEPKLEADKTETAITPCTDSSTVTEDVQKDVENAFEEVSTSPIHYTTEIVEASTNLNIATENETLSAVESTEKLTVEPELDAEKLIMEPKLETDKTETAITPCTDSSTVIVDVQKNVENVIEEISPGPIHSSAEVLGASINLNIDTENETLSPIESTEKLTVEPKIEADISETAITPCTDFSNVTVDVQKNVENVIEEISPGPIHSSAEVLGASTNLNIATEKLEADITETAITLCTDSSTVIVDVQKNVENVIEEISPGPIHSSIEVEGASTILNIDTENETLSPTEPTVILTIEPRLEAEKLTVEPEVEKLIMEPKLETDKTETAITPCTVSSTVSRDGQKDVENAIEEVSPGPIHSSAEVLGASINLNIDTENETLSPIESTEKLTVESKIEADISETAITPCTDFSNVTVDVQKNVENVIEEVSPGPIHSSIEVEGASTILNIDTENETLSPTEPTVILTIEPRLEAEKLTVKPEVEKLIMEPKLEADKTETAITPCTDSSTVTEDVQKDVENAFEEVSTSPIHYTTEIVEASTNLNIATENETLSAVESTEKLTVEPELDAEKLIMEPKLETDKTETAITPCTDSSTVIVDVQKNVENVIEEISPGPIHSSAEVLGASINLNIDTENETLSPIESTEKLTVEPKIEADISETAITPCTDFSNVTVDVQKNVENVIEEISPGPIHSSAEVLGASTNLNIATENETLSAVESTEKLTVEPELDAEKLIMEPKLETDKTETAITPCTDSSTVTKDGQKDVENAIEEVSPGPIHYTTEIVEASTNLNIATENETLSAVESTEKLTVEPKLEAEKLMVEPKLEADITETAITLCTDSSTVIVDVQKNVENVIEEISPGPIHSSAEVLGASINLNIDTENETLSPIESTEKLTVEPKIEADISETAITPCTDFSNVTVDVQKNVENVIEEVSPGPIHSSIEVEGASTILNIDTENETLSPTEPTVILTIEPRLEAEKLTVEPEVEKLIMEPKLETDKTETAITPCTVSSTVSKDGQKDVENAIEEVSPGPIHSSAEVLGASINLNIDTENETLSPIESTEKLTVESKIEADISETAITPCTDFSNVTVDVQKNVENVIEEVSPGPIHSSIEVEGASTILNIDTENETLSPTEPTVILTIEPRLEAEKLTVKPEVEKLIMEPKLEADKTETAITPCTDSSTVTEDVQKDVENAFEEVSTSPIHYTTEIVEASTNLNIATENETLSAVESTEKLTVEPELDAEKLIMEPKLETDKTETAITPCTDSSTVIVDVQKNVENVIEEISPGPIHSSAEVLGASINLNIDTENETLSPIESTEKLTVEPKIEADISETAITPCTDFSNVTVDVQKNVENVIEEVSPGPIHSSIEVEGASTILNIDTENETLSPTEPTVILTIEPRLEAEKLTVKPEVEKLIMEPKLEADKTETAITPCTDSSTVTEDVQKDVENAFEEVSTSPIHYTTEIVEASTNLNIATENETLSAVESTEKLTVEPELDAEKLIMEPKLETDKTETAITPCTDSSTVIVDVQKNVENVIEEISPGPIHSSAEVLGASINLNIDTENETLSPIESTEKLTVEPKIEADISETAITPCTDFSNVTVDVQKNVENVIEEVSPGPIHSSIEVEGASTILNIDTENETLSPTEPTVILTIEPRLEAEKLTVKPEVEKLIMEPKLEADKTETAITPCTDSSTVTEDVQKDVENAFEEVSPGPIHFTTEIVESSTNLNIATENETLSAVESTEKLMVEPKLEAEKLMVEPKLEAEKLTVKPEVEKLIMEPKLETDKTETAITPCTVSSTVSKDGQKDVEIAIEEVSPGPIHSSAEVLGASINLNIDTENETLSPIESTEKLTVEPKIEADITETAITLCSDSFTVIVDVQKYEENVIEEISPGPIHSSAEVLGASTNLNIDTENETLLQIDTSITAVNTVLEEKIIENIYSTPIVSPFLGEEKQINVIIDSKTETLWPIGTTTTFVDEPNVVGHISENEHAAPIDSSITSIKQLIKVDTETEIETLFLIDNLTESVKEQIVEKINENNTPTLMYSLAEIGEEGIKVNIDTDNSLLTINTSPTIVNDTKTPINCIVDVAEEQTKVNIETNNKTITPIDIFTTSVEEQLNMEYLCENENTTHIDLVTTMYKNQTKIDIETENETLLSIANTSADKLMEGVDKIMQNNLLLDFSVATELKGYEILTDTQTETSTSIDTLNTTVNRQTVKENFKEVESKIRIPTLTAFEEEQKSVEHIITENENVLSIGTSAAFVEEEIQVEEVIKNESATLISYSTTQDVAFLEEPKLIKNETTASRSSFTVMEEQTEVAAAEVVIDTCKESLDKTMIEKGTHNETPTQIDILVTAAEKQTDVNKVAENEIPILVNTSSKSVEKQIKTEKVTENETITLYDCEALSKIETNEFEAESENKTSTPVNNSASITIKQTEVEDLTERILQNDDIFYRNTKTNLIGRENKTENSDNPNNCYLKFRETSKMHRLENEDNLQRQSYGIQKLEMSVQRMETSDEDYYEKTFVQLEQTEKISKVDKVNIDGENKTIIDDKLYTVNESDLNAILCASSLEEALTLLDSKIKFKFKHKKSSSKINSVEYIPKTQTSDSNSSGVNTNFTDAREFFKEIEKKSKK